MFDTFTMIARPERTFLSSSTGTTGSLPVFSRSSSVEKLKIISSDAFSESDALSTGISTSGLTGEELLINADAVDISPRVNKRIEIKRFVPEFESIDVSSKESNENIKNFVKKSTVRNTLYNHYFVSHPQIFWGFTNYNCIHFPDISPTSSSIVYPSPDFTYIPTSDFTFEFYFKPSYSNDSSAEFNAGTLIHASSSFAISIVSGTQKDINGSTNAFRVMLQLSHSADISPSSVDLSIANNARSFPDDLIFLSDDNAIEKNKWSHISIRWSPNNDHGTGSFLVNSNNAGFFHISSGSVTTGSYQSDAIFIGNFFEGENSPSNKIAGFFNPIAVQDEGVSNPFGVSNNEPSTYSFQHPALGELHDVKIWKSYRNRDQVISGSKNGTILDDDLLFYLPVFFVGSVPNRKMMNTHLFDSNRESSQPFNTNLNFSIGGHDISIENFLKEFVKGNSPRLLFLTSSTTSTSLSPGQKVNDLLFQDNSFAKRNLTILPCDNGLFYPNFNLPNVEKEVKLDNLTSEELQPKSVWFGLEPSPFNPNREYQRYNYSYQEIGDKSSNLISVFSVSNIFYGEKIHPGSIEIIDTSFTGSQGTFTASLKDNGRGALYRADSSSPHATWSSIGASFYQEGILSITHPSFGDLFGKDEFSIGLKGEKSTHVLETQVIVPAWSITSSSNPTFKKLKSSDYANDTDSGFVYINQVNLHDDNFNVIAKAKMAQPIIKMPGDRIMFRIKLDF